MRSAGIPVCAVAYWRQIPSIMAVYAPGPGWAVTTLVAIDQTAAPRASLRVSERKYSVPDDPCPSRGRRSAIAVVYRIGSATGQPHASGERLPASGFYRNQSSRRLLIDRAVGGIHDLRDTTVAVVRQMCRYAIGIIDCGRVRRADAREAVARDEKTVTAVQ